jgi:anti-anti-sigma regulatory factor
VDEVARATRQSCESGVPIRLDLAAVSYVDGAGTRLLRDLKRQGVTLSPCTGYVAELLLREERQ